jgi:putative ABC transport system permease protein
MFGRNIEWRSYLISAVVTIGFSLLVNLVMTKKLRAIRMVESMKALD